jgi:DNA-directed RNA polymerase specialized sigma24 family protein
LVTPEPQGPHASSAFPPTRYSVIERLRSDAVAVRQAAFGDLVAGYWKPLYKHLRFTWRLGEDDARDLTQGFFAAAFEKGWLERFEPGKARFRTFVRLCADRHVQNWRQSAARLKRGGGSEVVSLDFEGVEREIEAHPPAPGEDPDGLFHQEFVRELFSRTVEALRGEFTAAGRASQLALFERHDLAPGEGVSYAELAAEHGLTVSQVTNHLAHVRRRFRALALDALRGLCGSDEEFRAEARELFGMEAE